MLKMAKTTLMTVRTLCALSTLKYSRRYSSSTSPRCSMIRLNSPLKIAMLGSNSMIQHTSWFSTINSEKQHSSLSFLTYQLHCLYPYKKELTMCIICASIPAVAAVGAKLNADQIRQPEEKRKPISRMTAIVIGMLVTASVIYHTLRWPT